MDIHKPKAAHSWREFLTEIGTIICGILIALGLEQGIEALHWRRVLGEQQEALNASIQHNDLAMRARLSLEPCIQRRLGELDEVFRRHHAGQPLGIVGPISRPGYMIGGSQMWDVALSDGSLAHMPLQQKAVYIRAFATWSTYQSTHLEERSAWIALQGLDHADELTAQDWSELRRTLETARDADRQMQGHLRADEWFHPMNDLKLKPLPDGGKTPMVAAIAATFCAPMLRQSGGPPPGDSR